MTKTADDIIWSYSDVLIALALRTQNVPYSRIGIAINRSEIAVIQKIYRDGKYYKSEKVQLEKLNRDEIMDYVLKRVCKDDPLTNLKKVINIFYRTNIDSVARQKRVSGDFRNGKAMFVYICFKYLGISNNDISKFFGNLRTSVFYYTNEIEARIEKEKGFYDENIKPIISYIIPK